MNGGVETLIDGFLTGPTCATFGLGVSPDTGKQVRGITSVDMPHNSRASS